MAEGEPSVPHTLLPARSQLPGIAWPAIPERESAMVLALLAQMQHAERLPPPLLEAAQGRQLRALCTHARDSVPFYRERLAVLGPTLDLERWSAIPVLERAHVQALGAALCSDAVPREHGPPRMIRTSGSTGRPVAVEKSALAGLFMKATMLREHLWHGRDFEGRLAAIRIVKDDPRALTRPGLRGSGWGASTSALASSGEGYVIDIHVPLAEQWQWLQSIDPHYLLTYPSNLRALMGLCSGESPLRSLRGVRTLGEMVDAGLREQCRAVLGVALTDEYSAQECGAIALQCPLHDHYHVLSETMLVEVLRADGMPCAAGECGRVVVTPLHEYRTPLLRYALGDYAEVGGPCDCGRTLPVLTRILGRSRNMITLPSGEQRWPLAGDSHYHAIAPIRQFQFIQRTRHRFEVRLVTARPLQVDEEEAFCAWVQKRFGYAFQLELIYCDDIARDASGKFEDFINASSD